MVNVFYQNKLIACSYFDQSEKATSSIYAMFDPDFKNYRLGIYTLLLEIEYAISEGLSYAYLGYSYSISSFYDYKKGFNGLERFNWINKWLELELVQSV